MAKGTGTAQPEGITIPVEMRERFGRSWRSLQLAQAEVDKFGYGDGWALYELLSHVEQHADEVHDTTKAIMDFIFEKQTDARMRRAAPAREATRNIDQIVGQNRQMLNSLSRADAREWLLADLLCACRAAELICWLEDYGKPIPTIAPRSRLQRIVLNHLWPEEEIS